MNCRQVGARPEVDLVDEQARRRSSSDADDHDQDLGAEVEDREDDVEPRRLLDADRR